MGISKKEIAHIAKLAMLKLTETEEERLAREFEKILEFVGKLDELDTENIEPATHVVHINSIFRDDIIVDSYKREIILENAPDVKGGYFKVPKIVE